LGSDGVVNIYSDDFEWETDRREDTRVELMPRTCVDGFPEENLKEFLTHERVGLLDWERAASGICRDDFYARMRGRCAAGWQGRGMDGRRGVYLRRYWVLRLSADCCCRKLGPWATSGHARLWDRAVARRDKRSRRFGFAVFFPDQDPSGAAGVSRERSDGGSWRWRAGSIKLTGTEPPFVYGFMGNPMTPLELAPGNAL